MTPSSLYALAATIIILHSLEVEILSEPFWLQQSYSDITGTYTHTHAHTHFWRKPQAVPTSAYLSQPPLPASPPPPLLFLFPFLPLSQWLGRYIVEGEAVLSAVRDWHYGYRVNVRAVITAHNGCDYASCGLPYRAHNKNKSNVGRLRLQPFPPPWASFARMTLWYNRKVTKVKEHVIRFIQVFVQWACVTPQSR